MAAEITEITDSNHPVIAEDVGARLEHILTDLHEVLQVLQAQGRLLAKHDAMLEEYRPLLKEAKARLSSPLASMLPGRRKGYHANGSG